MVLDARHQSDHNYTCDKPSLPTEINLATAVGCQSKLWRDVSKFIAAWSADWPVKPQSSDAGKKKYVNGDHYHLIIVLVMIVMNVDTDEWWYWRR